MHNLTEIISALQAWSQQKPLRLCVLFGSQATGKAHAHSDVDIALWPEKPLTATEKLTWLNELMTLLDNEVSLVLVSPDLDPVLGFEIVRDGRLILEREPGLWEKKRFHLWQSYTDSLFFRRAARQQLHQFAQEVLNGT